MERQQQLRMEQHKQALKRDEQRVHNETLKKGEKRCISKPQVIN